MKKACIFDLDGTLINTLNSLEYSVNITLNRLGFGIISREDCEKFIGNGARELLRRALLKVTPSVEEILLNKAMDIYQEVFRVHCMYQVELYKGIEELLTELKRQGIIMAILTNKPHVNAVAMVEELFGNEYFDIVQGQVDALPRKPDPKSITDIVERLNLQLEDVVYIGDSEVDILTGRNGNVDMIAVSWGFRSKKVLTDAGATIIIDEPKEILKSSIIMCN